MAFLLRKHRQLHGRRAGAATPPAKLVTSYQHRSAHRCLDWLLDRWVRRAAGSQDIAPVVCGTRGESAPAPLAPAVGLTRGLPPPPRCVLVALLLRQGLVVARVTPAEDVCPGDVSPPREVVEVVELELRLEEEQAEGCG